MPFHRPAGLAALVLTLSVAAPAAAQSIIKHPGYHPKYSFEAEPHLAADIVGEDGVGPGFRGTVVVMDNGFVESINNSIGIGFGADWIFYGDHCGGPRDDRSCDSRSTLFFPVVMQWNFWLHPKWSVFGEPGVIIHAHDGGGDNLEFTWFTIYGGGRFHFNDTVALTLRIGAPLINDNVVSIGASFLL